MVFFALAANLAIALSKLVVYFFTRSASMLSEAIHSAADTGNQILLLVGLKRSAKPEDELHSFGYSREKFFWAFLVAVQLFALGGLYSIIEGIKKILHPHPIENPALAVGLLLFAMAAEGFSFMKARKAILREKGNQPTMSFLKKTTRTELVVVYLEDLAALLGLVFALVAILLAHFTSNPVFDGMGSLLIGLLLVGVAIFLGNEMHSLIVGESAPREVMEFAWKAFESQPGVERVIYLKSMVLGDDYILLVGKLGFSPTATMDTVSRAIDRAEEEIRKKYPEVRKIFMEADVLK